MNSIRLWTTTDLSDNLMEEFSALVSMPPAAACVQRIEAFKEDLKASGVEAVLETADGKFVTHEGQASRIVNEGKMVEPKNALIYFIHFNHDYSEDAEIAYTAREVRRGMAENVIQEWDDEDLTQEDIDEGTEVYKAALNEVYNEDAWKGLSVHTFDPTTHAFERFS